MPGEKDQTLTQQSNQFSYRLLHPPFSQTFMKISHLYPEDFPTDLLQVSLQPELPVGDGSDH